MGNLELVAKISKDIAAELPTVIRNNLLGSNVFKNKFVKKLVTTALADVWLRETISTYLLK